MRSIILYASRHHGSTEALVRAIAKAHSVELQNVETEPCGDLQDYDLIGFASGIDFGKL